VVVAVAVGSNQVSLRVAAEGGKVLLAVGVAGTDQVEQMGICRPCFPLERSRTEADCWSYWGIRLRYLLHTQSVINNVSR